MAGVEAGPAIVTRWIIRICWEISCTQSVTISKVQSVKPEERQIWTVGHVKVGNQLLLLKDAFRFVFVDISCTATKWANWVARECPREWSVDVVSPQLVKPAGAQISQRQLNGICHLLLDTQSCLQHVWLPKLWIDPIHRDMLPCQSGQRRGNISRSKRWPFDHEQALTHPI